eukprot:TRINITY_DN1262_c0_g1_i1.p1 TRINITY_DN1262_c0_g1~~TRINITY_DN1262_c0_g1_i1.p1  ORF type:complete len:208 (+),score=39.94 TRINITY_DN1262_c0_g1_i1:106-729(+)
MDATQVPLLSRHVDTQSKRESILQKPFSSSSFSSFSSLPLHLIFFFCSFSHIHTFFVSKKDTSHSGQVKMGFVITVFLSIIAFILAGGLAFLAAFYVLSYGELEADQVNPFELGDSINPCLLIEYYAQFAMAGVLLLLGKWIWFLVAVGICVYEHGRRAKRGHRIDVAELFRKLPDYRKEAYVKLGLYVLLTGVCLYGMVMALISRD